MPNERAIKDEQSCIEMFKELICKLETGKLMDSDYKEELKYLGLVIVRDMYDNLGRRYSEEFFAVLGDFSRLLRKYTEELLGRPFYSLWNNSPEHPMKFFKYLVYGLVGIIIGLIVLMVSIYMLKDNLLCTKEVQWRPKTINDDPSNYPASSMIFDDMIVDIVFRTLGGGFSNEILLDIRNIVYPDEDKLSDFSIAFNVDGELIGIKKYMFSDRSAKCLQERCSAKEVTDSDWEGIFDRQRIHLRIVFDYTRNFKPEEGYFEISFDKIGLNGEVKTSVQRMNLSKFARQYNCLKGGVALHKIVHHEDK